MKPYVEISFMPNALASNPNSSHLHYKANISPPKDWNVWSSFIQTWIKHLIDRHGIDEVSTWKFEIWNEPNCGYYIDWGCCGCDCPYFDEYMDLYGNTSQAIKSVDTRLQVGGPSTAELCWINQFLNETKARSLSADFVSSHLYPSDPTVDKSQQVNAWYDALKTAGESIDGRNVTLYLSEFSSGNYGSQLIDNTDSKYASSFMIFHANKLQPLINDYNYGWMSYWALSDIFEEDGVMKAAPFNDGWGMQTIRGLPKPIFRALQLLFELGSTTAYDTIRTDMDNENGTVQAFTLKNAKDANRYAIFVGNWNLNNETISDEILSIELSNDIMGSIPKNATLYRIDENNVNPVSKWKSMGSPEYPTQQQLAVLNESTEFVTSSIGFAKMNPTTIKFENVTVPSYGVVVIDIQY